MKSWKAAGSSSKSIVELAMVSRCRGFRSLAIRSHTASRSSRGVSTELIPKRHTARRMNGITVVLSSWPAARPTLAMLPP